jgi:hypothetical protein
MVQRVYHTSQDNATTRGQEFHLVLVVKIKTDQQHRHKKDIVNQPFINRIVRNLPVLLRPGRKTKQAFFEQVQG